jgi:hypothetical protein
MHMREISRSHSFPATAVWTFALHGRGPGQTAA